MSTASFERAFVVSDNDSFQSIKADLESPRKVVKSHRDYNKDREKGLNLLAQRFSASQTR